MNVMRRLSSASLPSSAPPYRHLRGYSLDPGFSTRLDTAGINEVVYRVPFEALEPGPVGKYIEVMDFDPASKTWYEPVDPATSRSHHSTAWRQAKATRSSISSSSTPWR